MKKQPDIVTYSRMVAERNDSSQMSKVLVDEQIPVDKDLGKIGSVEIMVSHADISDDAADIEREIPGSALFINSI